MKPFSLVQMMVIKQFLNKEINNASLCVFRIVFGFIQVISLVRFILKGWIDDLYIAPEFHFYFFDFIKILPEQYLHSLFYLLTISAICITFGFFYRFNIIIFFLGFTYIELLDKTYYLNHYYAIILFSFLMIFLPLNSRYSFDSFLRKEIYQEKTKYLYLFILQFQIAIIYFYAGIAKINYDWLISAQPITTWLREYSYLPIIGKLFLLPITGYICSWFGLFFDLLISFFLFYKRTRITAYITVVIFHLMTFFLFNIGMFPLIMISITIIFFEADKFELLIKKIFKFNSLKIDYKNNTNPLLIKFMNFFFILYFIVQIFFPLRHFLYKGNYFWHEQGFRFSWHVMVIEKNGFIEFLVKDKNSDKKWIVNPNDYLTDLQVKMMSTQPDMIIQFTKYLSDIFRSKGYSDIEIYSDSFVSLNFKESKRFIRSDVNLLKTEKVSDFLLE